jgi:hypothetical protein
MSDEPNISILIDGFLGKHDADSSASYLVINFQLPLQPTSTNLVFAKDANKWKRSSQKNK